MRLKLYRAATVAEAMQSIRTELGPDALILSTRRTGDGVEVTAALDLADVTEVADAGAPPRATGGGYSARAASLAWHGIASPLADALQTGPLPAALAAALRFAPLPLAAGAPPLLLIGPPGAGKTLTVARLATRLVMGGVAPLVITADGRRAGATEQLAAFTRLLGLNLIVASHPATLARALGRRQDGAPVLIDAPGTDAFDPAQREEMSALAATAGATVALVIPAGQDPSEAADQAQAYGETGISMLVATRLDLARRLGSVLAAARAADLALAEAGIGPGAADGMVALTPAFLAERLVAPHAAIPRPVPPPAAVAVIPRPESRRRGEPSHPSPDPVAEGRTTA
jgi:flagellar biosynthesis protein FlhF